MFETMWTVRGGQDAVYFTNDYPYCCYGINSLQRTWAWAKGRRQYWNVQLIHHFSRKTPLTITQSDSLLDQVSMEFDGHMAHPK